MQRSIAVAAAAAAKAETLPLLREFIHEALYQPAHGYFSANQSPVGLVDAPIDFRNLWGKKAYDQATTDLRNRLQTWITPAELFSPTYGRGIANYILQQQARLPSKHAAAPFDIVEVGGGNGTLAADIMEFLREHSPKVYGMCSYTALDISKELSLRQQSRIAEAGHGEERFSVRQGDALQPEAWGQPSNRLTYVVMCEVLDNLPHDRVSVAADGQWQQTHVRGGAEHVMRPLTDPLISRCLDVLEPLIHPPQSSGFLGFSLLRRAMGEGGPADTVFLPTGAMQLMETMMRVRPLHHIIAADFDYLPEVSIPGLNAPIVSHVAQGQTQDRLSYLRPPAQQEETAAPCDIFFPTNFEWLAHMHKAAAIEKGWLVTSLTKKNADFMKAWADVKTTVCMDGYNPLLEDFSNTSVFLATCDPQRELSLQSPLDAGTHGDVGSMSGHPSWYRF
mmetsp:Transcript_2587/g.7719  ORF Transcript_2587/g.7719 Transcript_2587/m.7719 type:complete len:448 (-) Transcript_2587:112-1455(-)